MKFLLQFWYLILLALILSFVAAVGLIWTQRDEWLPEPPPVEVPNEVLRMEGMSDEYAEWNYGIMGVEDLRLKLESEQEEIAEERRELETLRSHIAVEMEELRQLRAEIDNLRESIRNEFIEIDELEQANIRRIADLYAEMKPEEVLLLFDELDFPLVVKIISSMPEESITRLLAEMTQDPTNVEKIKKAARITNELRRMR